MKVMTPKITIRNMKKSFNIQLGIFKQDLKYVMKKYKNNQKMYVWLNDYYGALDSTNRIINYPKNKIYINTSRAPKQINAFFEVKK